MAALAVTVPPDPDPFDVIVEQLDDIVVLGVRGELSIATAPRLDSAGTAAIAREPRGIVVDLTTASFIDSVAIGVLLRIAHAQGEASRHLLVACTEQARRVFEVAGLDRRLELHDSRAAALSALN